jgi:hypothetical protein
MLCSLADCQHGQHRLQSYTHPISIKGNQQFLPFLLLLKVTKKTRWFFSAIETFCATFCAS